MASKKTIADYDKTIEDIKRRRATLIKEVDKTARKKRSRQAFIVGGWLLANDEKMVEKIKLLLVRDQDRIAFDLAVLSKPGVDVIPVSERPVNDDDDQDDDQEHYMCDDEHRAMLLNTEKNS